MLEKPSEQQLKALRTLSMSKDWEPVKQWLEESLNKIRRSSDREPDETQLRWKQGAAQALSELLEEAEHVIETLKKRFG